MTDYKTNEDKKKDIEQTQPVILTNYVLTLSYTQVQPLEKLCQEIQRGFKIVSQKTEGEKDLIISGVTRIPTKKLKLCTRMSPCGNGTNTYDHWEMRIHKRVFQIKASEQALLDFLQTLQYDKQITVEVINKDSNEDED